MKSFIPSWLLIAAIMCDIGVAFMIHRDAGIATASAAFLAWSVGLRNG